MLQLLVAAVTAGARKGGEEEAAVAVGGQTCSGGGEDSREGEAMALSDSDQRQCSGCMAVLPWAMGASQGMAVAHTEGGSLGAVAVDVCKKPWASWW